MEHECMGPKLTHAEGFLLGVGAWFDLLDNNIILSGELGSTAGHLRQ